MTGIGDYDLSSSSDSAFAFDYDSSGKLDHLVLYRPGSGILWIVKNSGGTFSPVFNSGSGIGGYDLHSGADRAFAFDYTGSGKLDHIVLFRPGTGTVWILQNKSGVFSAVFTSGSGIGGFNLSSGADHAFAFDYGSTGKLDHLVFYRPGSGAIFILKNVNGVFSAVYAQGDPGGGIGDYDLHSGSDRAFAFDYNGNGKQDHLVLYRPGPGTIVILQNVNGTFTNVFHSTAGIGDYNLTSNRDSAFAYDYDGSGKLDHLVFYRPGTGAVFILKRSGAAFSPVYSQGDPGSGIGGYDLSSTGGTDSGLAFDYEGSGKQDYLLFYRPGTGILWILKNTAGTFVSVYSAEPPDAPQNLIACGVRVHNEGGFFIGDLRVGFSDGRVADVNLVEKLVPTVPQGVPVQARPLMLLGSYGRGVSVTVSRSGVFLKAEQLCGTILPQNAKGLEMWPIIDIVGGASNHQASQNFTYDPASRNIAVYNVDGTSLYPHFSFQELSTNMTG